MMKPTSLLTIACALGSLALAEGDASPPRLDEDALRPIAPLPAELEQALRDTPRMSIPEALRHIREHSKALDRPETGAGKEELAAAIDSMLAEYEANPQRFVLEYELNDIFSALQLENPDELAPLIHALIREGAELEADHMGSTPLMQAATNRAYNCARLFLAYGVPVDARDRTRLETALACAVAENDVRMMKLLLRQGASLGPNSQDGETLLMVAVDFDAMDAARLLREQGVPIDAENADRQTALMIAAYAGKPEFLRYLLDQGAAIEGSTEHGPSPLLLVAQGCNNDFEACARLLLDRGAKVDATDAEGNTPLIEAARHRDATPALVKLLLERGADVHHKNQSGDTALTPLGSRAVEILDALPAPKPEVKKLLEQKTVPSKVR